MADIPSTPWMIELFNAQMPEPLQLEVTGRVIIGRSVAGTSEQPDIDLAPYGAEEFGVSRLHLALDTEDDLLMITDLESGNGSFLNNNRIQPNHPYPLSHGDQIHLGRMRLDIRVLISPVYGGDIHKQPSLQVSDQTKPGQGELIQIIEDDPGVARILALTLDRVGYKTFISQEVVSAIRMFNQKRPSLVILDLMLPGMNGLEFCRYIRRDTQYNLTPIVVVSAIKSDDKVAETMQAGADIFLQKPVSAKELRHVVSSLIDQRDSGVRAIHTKHLVGTAPLQEVKPESRSASAVLFVAGHSEAPIVINVQQPVTVGRAGSTSELGSKKHVDLSRFDAVNYGVSRKHMRLHNIDGQFFVEDLDTVNGTYVNGERIPPHELIPVDSAHEIRLGGLRAFIYFLEDDET